MIAASLLLLPRDCQLEKKVHRSTSRAVLDPWLLVYLTTFGEVKVGH